MLSEIYDPSKRNLLASGRATLWTCRRWRTRGERRGCFPAGGLPGTVVAAFINRTMTTLMSGLARPLVQSRCLLNARAIVVPCRLSACGIEKADNLIRLLTWIR